jgi:hypothetical protein
MKILAGVLALVLLGAQEAKHPWAKWKADSSAKFKMTVEAGGNTLEGEYKSVLTEVTEKGYAARHISNFMGTETVENETATFEDKKGEETLKVGEKELKCVVWSSSGKRGEKAVTSKAWMSGASENPVKLTWKSGEDETGEFAATKLSDKITVAGKELDAVLLEGQMGSPETGMMKGKIWMHPAVPGGVARMELSNDQAKIKIELVEFDAKK